MAKSKDSKASALSPVDPSSVPESEREQSSKWVVRKIAGSMTGRMVMSAYESLRATGTGVVCLSPWGDSSPLVLPCIRFRDLVVDTAVAATGGTAAVAAPIMDPVTDAITDSIGSSIAVEAVTQVGGEIASTVADDLLIGDNVDRVLHEHSKKAESAGVKTLLITLKYKYTVRDASLGFYRSGMHKDKTMFSSVKDYLGVQKGWFSPYLFASGRRPIIPRSIQPDVVFCHGPFISGDYQIGTTLLSESPTVLSFSSSPPPSAQAAAQQEPQPKPRRMVILLLGLKSHRGMWSTSARPEESVIHYQIFNACPAIVIPVEAGAPLLAWYAKTVEQLWKVPAPVDGTTERSREFENVVNVLFEFLDLCIDWPRFEMPQGGGGEGSSGKGLFRRKQQGDPRNVLRSAAELLVTAAIKCGNSKEVRKEVNQERAGIAIWRIP